MMTVNAFVANEANHISDRARGTKPFFVADVFLPVSIDFICISEVDVLSTQISYVITLVVMPLDSVRYKSFWQPLFVRIHLIIE